MTQPIVSTHWRKRKELQHHGTEAAGDSDMQECSGDGVSRHARRYFCTHSDDRHRRSRVSTSCELRSWRMQSQTVVCRWYGNECLTLRRVHCVSEFVYVGELCIDRVRDTSSHVQQHHQLHNIPDNKRYVPSVCHKGWKKFIQSLRTTEKHYHFFSKCSK